MQHNFRTGIFKIIATIACIIPSLLQAQENTKENVVKETNFLVSLSAGPSVPLSDFGNKDLNDPSSGLAKTGLNYQLSFNYLIGENFGIGTKAFYFYNPQDPNVWLNNFLQNASPNQFFKVTTFPWEFKGLAGGLYGTFDLENNYADVKFLIGYASVNFPKVLVELQEGNQKASLFIDAQKKMVPTFELNFALRIPMVDQLNAIIDFSFLNTEVQFDVFDNDRNFLYSQTNRVSVSNISLGCAYKF